MGCYLVLACAYAANTPVFESPDESSHLQVIQFIARERRLPPYQVPEVRASTGPAMAWLISYHDPPLYYAPPLYHALAALLTRSNPMGDLAERLAPSPSWEQGFSPERGSDPWNKNVFVHLPDETIAGSETVRAAALLRALSILLGAVVVVCTYSTACMIWPERSWLPLVAAAWLAANPQFIASHTGVSNDPLTNALFSLSLLVMLHLLRGEAAWWRWAGLGGLVGLAALTKQNGLLLGPLVGLAALLSAFGGHKVHSERTALLRGAGRAAAFGAAAVLVGAWWYLANIVQNGDLLGTAPHFDSQVALARFGWQAVLGTLQSYWAAFGWALITAPWWAYVPFAGVAGFGLMGGIKALYQNGRFRKVPSFEGRAVALLALAVGMNGAAFVRWATATGAPYGRLLFATAGAAGILLAWGLAQWQSKWVRYGLTGLFSYAFLIAALLPWTLLAPAFRSPYQPDGVPVSATATADVKAGTVRLAGYELTSETAAPGDRIAGTLYWRSEPFPTGATSFAHLTLTAQLRGLDPTARLADDTRWLGGTLYPTQAWRAGDVVAHRVTLDIPDWASVPSLVWLDLRLLDQEGHLLTYDPGGGDARTLGPWRVRGVVEIPKASTRVGARLGTAIRLEAYEAWRDNEDLVVDLYWRAAAVPQGDATVFFHLVDTGGVPLDQDDGPPAEGAYPTSWWLVDDVVRDRHTVRLADSRPEYRLRVGMYVPTTGERLPASGSDGERLPDDAVVLWLPD